MPPARRASTDSLAMACRLAPVGRFFEGSICAHTRYRYCSAWRALGPLDGGPDELAVGCPPLVGGHAAGYLCRAAVVPDGRAAVGAAPGPNRGRSRQRAAGR